MNIKVIKVGMLETNCYILENDEECLIIDPGDDVDKICDNISKKVVGVLLTHRHFDHVGALEGILNIYKVPVYNKSNLDEGDIFIGSFKFSVNYNPGHTMDSISFIFDDIMFSGDFVFEGCIGRWDLGGDFSLMQSSIKFLLKSNINYKIYPGHGNITTLEKERDIRIFYSLYRRRNKQGGLILLVLLL